MDPVKASARPNPATLISDFQRDGLKQGFRIETMGEAAGYPLLAMTKRTPGMRPRIYLSAGSHGDEPAGPAALLALLQTGFFDQRAHWFICPLINPSGLARGTRENLAGIDLNRDYRGLPKSPEVQAHVTWLRHQPRFDLHICVHEDWESVGFYLYELNAFKKRSLAEDVLAAVAPICPIDQSPLIDERENNGGIIRPSGDPTTRELWPESIFLLSQYSQLGYTLETPSAFPINQRIAAHKIAITTLVEGIAQPF